MKHKSVATNSVQASPPEQRDSVAADLAQPPPAHTAHWHGHEHQADSTRLQAMKLIEETGSPDLAKHAVDMAAPALQPAMGDDAQAREFGFESYAALCDASLPLTARGGEAWMITDVGSGRWIVWTKDAWPEHKVFDSYEHAELAIQGGSHDTSKP